VIDGNHFHNNHGNGLWTDVPNSPQNITISNNRVEHNDDHGRIGAHFFEPLGAPISAKAQRSYPLG
jgi:hypothetical protein